MNLFKWAFFSMFGLGLIAFLIYSGLQPAPECLYLTNATYFDSATNGYLKAKVIAIEKNVIKQVLNTLPSDAAAKRCLAVDLTGRFLFPGFIDAHTHLLAGDTQKVTSWKSALELSAARPYHMRIFKGESNARSMLFSGFTTVRDLGNSGGFLDAELAKRIKRKISSGPRIIYSGPGLALAPTQINLRKNSNEYTVINEKSDLDEILAPYLANKATWIKIYSDNSVPSDLISSDFLLRLTNAAHAKGFKVALHAEFAASLNNAVKVSADSIEHFYEIPQLPDGFSKTAMPFAVLTEQSLETCRNLNLFSDCTRQKSDALERTRWLRQNSFKPVFGSDAVLDFSSKFKSRGQAALSSLISLTENGFSPAEAIQAATATAGELLGLPIGHIATDHEADLIAFATDPLRDLNAIKTRSLIVQQGRIVCQSERECRE